MTFRCAKTLYATSRLALESQVEAMHLSSCFQLRRGSFAFNLSNVFG